MDELLIEVNNITKKFCRNFKRSLAYGLHDIMREVIGQPKTETLRKDEFFAIKDVSFSVKRGHCLGIIGPNGAGKSSLLKVLTGIYKPEFGTITTRGKISSLIQLATGFNALLTGRENVYIKAAILGMNKKEVDLRMDEIIAFAELEESIDSPVKNYSSGMVARLGFSIAVHTEPDILIIDEVLAVGDAGFKNKCFTKIREICQKAAVIFISHNIHSVNRICDSVIIMDQGKVIKHHDSCATAIEHYLTLFSKIEPTIETSNLIKVDNIKLNRDQLQPVHHQQFHQPLSLEFDFSANTSEELEVKVYIVSLNLENLAMTTASLNPKNSAEKQKVTISVDCFSVGVDQAYITLQINNKVSKKRIYQNYAMALLSITGNHEVNFSPNVLPSQITINS